MSIALLLLLTALLILSPRLLNVINISIVSSFFNAFDKTDFDQKRGNF